MNIRTILLTSALALAVMEVPSAAQSRIVVKFAHGAHSATFKGEVQKYKYVDYILNAREGQSFDVALTSSKGTAQFVVFKPTDENVEDAAGVTEYSGVLEMSGNYKVRVLLPRSEARRPGSGTSFTVKFTIR